MSGNASSLHCTSATCTWTSRNLCGTREVEGYAGSPGAGNSVKPAILDGGDPGREGIKTPYENAVMLRVIFKL